MERLYRLRKEGLEWREVEGEIVVLDMRRSLYLAINASGAPMWRLLADAASKQDLVDALQGEAGIEAGAAATDVERFLDQLSEQDLLEPEEESA